GQLLENGDDLLRELELLLVLLLVEHLAVAHELGVIDADVVEHMDRGLRALAPVDRLRDRSRGEEQTGESTEQPAHHFFLPGSVTKPMRLRPAFCTADISSASS